MIKTIILASTLLFSVITDDKYEGLTKEEKKFVKNIELIELEVLQKVYRTSENTLMVEFGTIKYLLNSETGHVDNVWVLGDDDITWEELGPEY